MKTSIIQFFSVICEVRRKYRLEKNFLLLSTRNVRMSCQMPRVTSGIKNHRWSIGGSMFLHALLKPRGGQWALLRRNTRRARSLSSWRLPGHEKLGLSQIANYARHTPPWRKMPLPSPKRRWMKNQSKPLQCSNRLQKLNKQGHIKIGKGYQEDIKSFWKEK